MIFWPRPDQTGKWLFREKQSINNKRKSSGTRARRVGNVVLGRAVLMGGAFYGSNVKGYDKDFKTSTKEKPFMFLLCLSTQDRLAVTGNQKDEYLFIKAITLGGIRAVYV